MADTIQIKYLAVLLLMIICGFLAIDIHLASMPHIMRYLNTDQQHMQQSISTFLLGMGVSLLFYGPLSDHFGRKPVIAFGLLLAAVSSFAAALSHEISTFLILRVLQGVGSGVCAGLGRAVLADMYRGNQLTHMASYFGMVVALSPLVAPVVGGYIQAILGWQANFIVLGAVFILALTLYTIIFPETNKHRYSSQFSVTRIVHNYCHVLTKKQFIGFTLLSGIGMAGNMVYATTSAFIFQHGFSLTAVQYGWVTAVAGLGAIVGRMASSYLTHRIGSIKALLVSQSMLLFAGVVLALLIWRHFVTILLLILVVLVTIASQAITQPCTTSNALGLFETKRGAASAVYGGSQQLIAFLTSAIVGAIAFEGVWLWALAYMLLGFTGLAVFFILIGKKHNNES